MEEPVAQFESSNINTLWTNNILENLKNLENMERLAREGCESLMDYIQIPNQFKHSALADIQYKNLKLMVTETDLLLTDCEPVLNEKVIKDFREKLALLQPLMEKRDLFLHEPFSQTSKRTMQISLKEPFYRFLEMVTLLRRDVIKALAPMLYMKGGEDRDSDY